MFNNNLVVHANLLQYENFQLGNPQIGADFNRGNLATSFVTDFDNLTIQFGTSPHNKKVSKMIKMAFSGDNLSLSPCYERDITKNLRIFFQVDVIAGSVAQNQTELRLGGRYGYRLKIMEEMKIELSSNMGNNQNFFQITLISSKFRASFPILTSSDAVSFETKKLIIFVAFFAIV